MNKLSIGIKVGIVPIVAICSFILYLSFIFTAQTNNSTRLVSVQKVYFPLAQNAGEARYTLDRIKDELASAAAAGDMEAINQSGIYAEEIRKILNRMRQIASDKNMIDEAIAQFDRYYASASSLSMDMIQGTVDFSNVQSLVEAMQASQQAIETQLDNIKSYSFNSFNEQIELTQEASENTLYTGFALAAITILIMSLISFYVIKMITSNVRKVTASLENFAAGNGNLSEKIHTECQDELGELVDNFNLFVQRLRATIYRVVETIEPLLEVSKSLDEAAHSFHGVSQKQTAVTDSVTQAVAMLVNGVKEVSENASDAANLAAEVDTASQDGRSSMKDTVKVITDLVNEVGEVSQRMEDLKSETDSVYNIVEVIRSVAEQTNLLALNAAIEAARAGEQGRGFAVVADEVRTLASRTQESTQQIQDVIDRLQNSTVNAASTMKQGNDAAQAGLSKAEETGQSFTTITEKFTSMTDLNHRIAHSSEEQETAVMDIQESIEKIRQNSESARASTNNIVEMSTSLSEISKKLQEVSSQFRLGDEA